jgi:hypothetical protein
LAQHFAVGRRQQGVASTGRFVMSESMVFRQYAKEAIAGSLKSKDENEKQILNDLARMWMRAASASETMFTLPVSLPHPDEATPLTRS